MPDFSRRAQKAAQGLLDPGEQFVFAGVAQPPGSISRGVSERGTAGRGVASALGHKRGEQDGQLADRVPTRNGYLAVTSTRLLWLGTNLIGWPAKEILTAWAPTDVVGVTDEKGPGFRNRLLTITFADGSDVSLVVHVSQKPDQLIEALRTHAS